ncbi:MAG: YjgP/YjgQ family permease [Microscillaceae bacterium]|nr:YjgP/YjgQ family permease [Microscillaceae bacterium]
MKKVDRLVLGAFIGPFVLTTAVVMFILLIQQLTHHIDDLLGKGLSYWIFAELCFYFSMHFIPLALPLGILLSSLITFGNLGEHQELTALKASGISLVRVLRPIMGLVLLVMIGSYFFNDRIFPYANLKAYRLLWDIKQKSPSLSIKEGTFYNGLPGYSIKINHKETDGKTIRDIMIYDHTESRGNQELILADSGRMYTIRGDRYLVLELFRGKSYHDQVAVNDGTISNEKFVRTTFDRSQVVFNLSSLEMKQTDERLFQQHRYMRNTRQLQADIDSLDDLAQKSRGQILENLLPNYRYHLKPPPRPLARPVVQPIGNNAQKGSPLRTAPQMGNPAPTSYQVVNRALALARNLKTLAENRAENAKINEKSVREFTVELYKKFTLAVACLTMFLIGAPLGAIIKKGGLGVPVLISILFFIAFYVMSLTGEKWVKEGFVAAPFGMWIANVVLLAFGLFFLRQARNDSRLFETDFYLVWWEQARRRSRKKAQT